MQPSESNQHTAVNSRQTLQGTDVDIKELAIKIAEEMGGNLYTLMDRCEDFSTRLIAAYCEKQTQRIATLEQQNAELVAALELCKFDSLNMSLEDLVFIRSVVAKVKQP